MNMMRPFYFLGLIIWAVSSHLTYAQTASNYPTKPIKIIVGFSPGGSADAVGRSLAEAFSTRLGQPVVVENRAGANGNIAAETVARAAPDGYTLYFPSIGHAVNVSLYKNLPYDPIKDFTSIGGVFSAPNMLVVPMSSPYKTVSEIIAAAKANPGKLNFGSGGSGSSTQLAAEVFKTEAGVSITHIPYRGAGAAASSLLAGQIDMLITAAPTAIPHITSGRTRALAITGKDRLQILPEVPTFSEAGLPSFNIVNWFGLAAPKGTPPAIVNKIRDLVAEAMKDPNLRNNFAKQGAAFNEMSVETFGNFVNSEIVKWSEEGNKAGVKPE